jgi:hypothetical protein
MVVMELNIYKRNILTICRKLIQYFLVHKGLNATRAVSKVHGLMAVCRHYAEEGMTA